MIKTLQEYQTESQNYWLNQISQTLKPERKLSAHEYLERFKIELPDKPKELFIDVVSGKVKFAAIRGGRGCGKTWTASAIQTALYDMGYDWFNLGGSKTQANKCYARSQEIINGDEKLKRKTIKSIQSETKSIFGNTMWISAASEKQVRGPHVGGKTRGGGLSLDEEDEMDPKIVKAALSITNTAHPAVRLRMSTGHKAGGTFKRVCDNAKAMGYKFYTWDCFDISEKCNDNCSECFKEFRNKYCKGKAKKNKVGWMAISEIKQLWVECEENKEWFEVELMGWQIVLGKLIYNTNDIENCECESTEYQKEIPTYIGIDWGFLKDRLCMLAMQFKAHERHIIDVKYLSGHDDYLQEVEDWHKAYKISQIYADSSHPFQNNEIQLRLGVKYNFNVIPVVFGVEKESGISNVDNGLSHGWYKIPKKFTTLLSQLKNYSRDKNGKPKKIDDHGPDALLCVSEVVKPRIDLKDFDSEEEEGYEEIERVII